MNLLRLLALLFFMGAAFPVFGQEGDRPIVQELTVDGNHALPASDLKLLMVTRKSPWYDWLPWVSPLRFDPAAFKADVVRIAARYRDLGYFEAAVDTVVDRSHPERVCIQMRIEEGEVVRVSGVALEGVSGIAEVDSLEIRKRLRTASDRPLVRAGLEEDQAFIARQLQDRGYAFAEVSVKVGVKPERHLSEVTYRVAAGSRCWFGGVRVEGSQKVSRDVIRRGLTFRAGEIYRKQDLLNSQRQLYRSGAFRSVALGLPDSLSRTSPVEVVISVHERAPRSVKVGAEYNTEEDFKGSLEWTHRNFLGGARQLRLETALSRLNANAQVDLRQPYIWGSRTWLNLGTFVRRERVPRERQATFRKDEVGGNVSLERNIRTRTNLIFQVSTGLVNFEADSAFTELRLAFLKDTRDDFFDPKDGMLVNLTVRERGLLFRSDREFLQLTGEGRWYRRLPLRSVLAVRALAGVIQELGGGVEVPNIERFFGGGMNSVRGWSLNQLGPRDASGDVVGGQSRVGGSIELRTRLLSFLGTALFVDAGRVGLDYDAFILNELQWSVGAGLRYLSPIGPIRLDVAYRISEDPFVGSRQVHLSLGQAF